VKENLVKMFIDTSDEIYEHLGQTIIGGVVHLPIHYQRSRINQGLLQHNRNEY